MNRFVREFVGSLVSSAFDPEPIHFHPADERGVQPVRRACGPNGPSCRLKVPLNRNAFLCGCLDFTEYESVEHLIVGLGVRYGSTTKVLEIGHVFGTEKSVEVPGWLHKRMHDWLAATHRNEALVFHNHPSSPLNVLYNNAPLPSGTDRNTLLAYYLRPVVALKALLGGGRVRFYLGENGFVREFRTPELLELLGLP